MCWIGFKRNKWVADKDIHCKKVIGYDEKVGVYRPWIMRSLPFFYEIGQMYATKLEIKTKKCGPHFSPSEDRHFLEIMTGLHCYANSLKVYKHHDYSMIVGNNLFTGDQHTLRPVLVDCIIPRGATYYENERGEIVTNKLKLVKIYEFTDEETDSHIRGIMNILELNKNN